MRVCAHSLSLACSCACCVCARVCEPVPVPVPVPVLVPVLCLCVCRSFLLDPSLPLPVLDHPSSALLVFADPDEVHFVDHLPGNTETRQVRCKVQLPGNILQRKHHEFHTEELPALGDTTPILLLHSRRLSLHETAIMSLSSGSRLTSRQIPQQHPQAQHKHIRRNALCKRPQVPAILCQARHI